MSRLTSLSGNTASTTRRVEATSIYAIFMNANLARVDEVRGEGDRDATKTFNKCPHENQ